jgi:hypothetical protein
MSQPFSNADFAVSKYFAYNSLTAATVTLSALHLFAFNEFVRAGVQTLDIPLGSSIPFSQWSKGGYCYLLPTTANAITISPDSGVLLNGSASDVTISGTAFNASVILQRLDLNAWRVYYPQSAAAGWDGNRNIVVSTDPSIPLDDTLYLSFLRLSGTGPKVVSIAQDIDVADYPIGGSTIIAMDYTQELDFTLAGTVTLNGDSTIVIYENVVPFSEFYLIREDDNVYTVLHFSVSL